MNPPTTKFSHSRSLRFGLGALAFLLAAAFFMGVPVHAENEPGKSKLKPVESKSQEPEGEKPSIKLPTTDQGATENSPSKSSPSRDSDLSQARQEKPVSGKPVAEREKKGDGTFSDADKTSGKSIPKSQSKVPEKLNADHSKTAESKTDKKPENVKPGSEKGSREAIALQFAKRHHPELAELLHQLKRGNEAEYDRAVRDLYQTSEKLARIQEKTPERYDFAVSSWKLDSRIRLLSARIVMSDSPALEAELKELLRSRHELKLNELKKERSRVATRLSRLDTEIQALENDTDGRLQKELQVARKQLTEQASELKSKPTRKPSNDSKGKGDSKSSDVKTGEGKTGDGKTGDGKKTSVEPSKELPPKQGSEKKSADKKAASD